MRVAYVSFFPVWPPYSGASAVTWGCVSHTPGSPLLVQVGGRRSAEFTVDRVRVITLRGGRQRLGRLLGLPRALRNLEAVIRRHTPGLVVLEGASWVVYSWLAARHLRRARAAPRLVYHAHNVEFTLRRGGPGWPLSGLTKWAERRLLTLVDDFYAVSQEEAAEFEHLYGRRPRLWPNGVDPERFDAVTPAQTEDARARYGLEAPVVLFMGSYRYPPNRAAIDFLVRHVFPRVVARISEARLAIVGGPVPYEQPWLVNPGKIVHEELPALVRCCRVGVAPVFSGAGTRVKILEYMAGGLPVVATAKGAEGLGLAPNIHYLVGEDADTFAQLVTTLLAEPDAARRMAHRARSTVCRRFAWPVILESCGFRNGEGALGVAPRPASPADGRGTSAAGSRRS